jgi:hypothetical protein
MILHIAQLCDGERMRDRTRSGSDIAYLVKQTDYVAQLTYLRYACNPKVIPSSQNHSDPEMNEIPSDFGLLHLSNGDARFGMRNSLSRGAVTSITKL